MCARWVMRTRAFIRGAARIFRNILEFEQDFPNAKIIRLEQNYRFDAEHTRGGRCGGGEQRAAQGQDAVGRSGDGGAMIGYYEAPDGENEALFIADKINKYLREATSESGLGRGDDAKTAVLYRTNSQSRLVEEALRRYGIKYTMVGGFSFYERAEIRDLLSYLKLVLNPA